jgi:hypothetical protein
MARIRKIPKEIRLDRVFTPGRLRDQWLAAAYERLVPTLRLSVRQEPSGNHQPLRKEAVWT